MKTKPTSICRMHLPGMAAAMALASILALTSPSTRADTVWNVNIGGQDLAGYQGAATENPAAGSTWNSVTSANFTGTTLADSTGSNAAGVSLDITTTATIQYIDYAPLTGSGDKIFDVAIKDSANSTPFSVVIGNLNTGATYDLIVYSDWLWKANNALPVTQTAGTGMTGTIYSNRDTTFPAGSVGPLLQDTDPTNTTLNTGTNFYRITGLTPNATGDLGFGMGGTDSPLNGFQLIEKTSNPGDGDPPTPDPMTWALGGAPASAGETSITMTATTATDPGGVQYYFTNETWPDDSHDSGWQTSPTYTDTGLAPDTTYAYTVKARDGNQNTTDPSTPSASATTDEANNTVFAVWNVNFGSQITPSDNYVGAAVENTQNSTWNSITSTPQAAMALADSTGSSAAGVTLDLTSSKNISTTNLNGGDEIFFSYIGGAGATSDLTIKGLTMIKTYDLIIYSDWWWKNGDSYPVTQTAGTGLTSTIYINRILSGTDGIVPALTEDTNPADVTTGAGNIGNWYRIEGLIPDVNGHLAFHLGDGANAPINGLQLLDNGLQAPRADMLTFELSDNPAVISGANVTLTVPYGTDVTSLAPTFTLWPGATCVPVSGTARDFTSPQTYTVTSSDSLVTKNYTVTVVIAPPLPEFALTAPATWNGRPSATVQSTITNQALLDANGGGSLNYVWSVNGLAVSTEQTSPDALTLVHSQGSGALTVTLAVDNGGFAVTESVTVNVQEPASDPWVERTPGASEKPVTGQFFARNPDTGIGTIHYNGTQGGSPDDVFLKIYTTDGGDVLYATHRQSLTGNVYAFSVPVAAGKVTYKVVYGTRTGGVDTSVATVTDLVCGDAYIIEGQSNAVATDNSDPRDNTTSPWIRTYGRSGGGWGYARNKAPDEFWEMNIGFWGMALAESIVADHDMPVCIINGAVGGTRVDQHQANPADHTVAGGSYAIYANLLNRVIDAKLTHGIRGLFWHQGESDGSNFGPISDWDYTAYEQNFLNMSLAWKEDYPNLQRYIIYQVMPNPCNIGPKGDQVREVLRTLPRLYSNMNILNTLGLPGYLGCHFSAAGYTNMANLMTPLVNQDFYGVVPATSVTAPNLVQAYYTTPTQNAIVLEFDQDMTAWDSGSNKLFFLDGVAGLVSSGSVSGNVVTLQLSAPSTAATLTYLKDSIWNNVVADLVYGANGIAALTFADVPIGALPPSAFSTWASDSAQGLVAGVNDGPLDDPNLDGISNLLEFVLLGDPLVPSSATLPTVSSPGGGTWFFEYERSDLSAPPATTQVVEYGTDLENWTEVSIPLTSAGTVTITLGSTSDHISVALPDLGARIFARLKVNEE